jgi:hypothetical protein
MTLRRLHGRELTAAAVSAAFITIACSQNNLTGPSNVASTELFVRQLEQRGLAVTILERTPASAFPFFSVTAQRVLVNGETVHVFEYPTVAAAQADAGRVAPAGSPIGTTQVTWIHPPRFYRSAQLIVLYVGTHDAVAGHLEAVLGKPFAGG